jgi:hypothetical protein
LLAVAAFGLVTGLLAGPVASPAAAADLPPLFDEPLTLDVTNTAIFDYHFDNRNTPLIPDRSRPSVLLDDHYGDFVDRLNVQLGWSNWRFGVRLDTAVFFAQDDLEDARARATDLVPDDPEEQAETAVSLYKDLATRYRNTIYPAKLWLTYSEPGVEATVGDFYAQLGRGFVLSVRKIDELSIDTTIRGGKVSADHDLGPVRIAATALAGQLNPQRVDEIGGRILTANSSPLFFGFPQPRSVIYYEFRDPADPDATTKPAVRVVDRPQPSYLEDTVIGGRLEIGNETVQLGANGSLLLRRSFSQCSAECEGSPAEVDACLDACTRSDPETGTSRQSNLHDIIRTVSGTINFPNIGKHADLYVEVAGQQLRNGQVRSGEREADYDGYAIYGSGTVRGGPVSVSLEGKHYRRFFPLSANVDAANLGFSAPEFQLLSYNSPPTAEAIYVEPLGASQVCNSGGRARVDYRFNPHWSVYTWLGHYVSFSESQAANDNCLTDDELRTNTWDGAVGVDASLEGGKSHVRLWTGFRENTHEVPTEGVAGSRGGPTPVFYREGYVRYDLTKHISGPFAVQAQGFHRRRVEPGLEILPWFEGENYTALQWSPHLSAVVGYEYTTSVTAGCSPGADKVLCHYVNGGIQYKSNSSDHAWEQVLDTVTLFVGQRRGAVRCVSGVCRLFPPFEGAKLEVVSRF